MRQVSIALTGLAVALCLAGPITAQDRSLSELMDQLAQPDAQDVQGLQDEIRRRWARSGSAAVDFLIERGDAALEQGNLIRAVEHFTAAIDHAPDFAEAWNGRAAAYYLQGEFGLSMSDIRVALALNPQHYGAMTGLALILEDVGDTSRAYAAYQMADALNPHQPVVTEALDRLGRALGADA